jgi:hypothetical protein
MSILNFSDITLAGAYACAIKAARESDRHNAERHFETDRSHTGRKSLWALVKRFAATLAQRRRASSPLTSRPA